MTHQRAVSDVLGYVLIIAMVTLLIGSVMTLGVGGLQEAQTGEQANNMERAFDVLADNLEQMHARDAPSRGTEIRLMDGQVAFGGVVQFNVTVNGSAVGNLSTRTRPIVYENDEGTEIAYEGGAVVRRQGNASVMTVEPAVWIGENETIVPVVRTRPLAGTSERREGARTIMIRGDGLATSQAVTSFSGTETINIRVKTPRPTAWDSFLSDLDVDGDVSVDGDTVELTYNKTDYEVIVVRQRIRISLQD